MHQVKIPDAFWVTHTRESLNIEDVSAIQLVLQLEVLRIDSICTVREGAFFRLIVKGGIGIQPNCLTALTMSAIHCVLLQTGR